MTRDEHFKDIMEETRRNWPHIDTKSGAIREAAWQMARQFAVADRRRRLTWLRRGKKLSQFLFRQAMGAVNVINSAEKIARK